jgi:hypothetical protein
VPEFTNVFEFGDIGDKFYMILKGIVSIQVPNQKVKNWDFYWNQYSKLKEWKSNFDLRVEESKK